MSKVLKLSSHRIDRLREIKASIDTNIATIKMLVEQAGRFADALEKVEDEEAKKALKDVYDNVVKSIDRLLETTDNMFDAYLKIIEDK